MKTKSLLRLASLLSLFITILHIFGGQISLVDPLFATSLTNQIKVEWLGVWHMISILLIWMTFQLFQQSKKTVHNIDFLKSLSGLNYGISLAFIGASIWMQQHAPQWILFLPLALLIHYCCYQLSNQET